MTNKDQLEYWKDAEEWEEKRRHYLLAEQIRKDNRKTLLYFLAYIGLLTTTAIVTLVWFNN